MTEHSTSFDRNFQQEQIARAAEPRVGIQSAGNIKLIPLDAERENLTQKIEENFSEE
jgi:hypothetical protein